MKSFGHDHSFPRGKNVDASNDSPPSFKKVKPMSFGWNNTCWFVENICMFNLHLVEKKYDPSGGVQNRLCADTCWEKSARVGTNSGRWCPRVRNRRRLANGGVHVGGDPYFPLFEEPKIINIVCNNGNKMQLSKYLRKHIFLNLLSSKQRLPLNRVLTCLKIVLNKESIQFLSRGIPTHYEPRLTENKYEQHNASYLRIPLNANHVSVLQKDHRSTLRTPGASYLCDYPAREGSIACWMRTVRKYWQLSHFVECFLNTVPHQRQEQNHQWIESVSWRIHGKKTDLFLFDKKLGSVIIWARIVTFGGGVWNTNWQLKWKPCI